MILFHIAESTRNISLNIALADTLAENPGLFRENVKIASYFGSPPVLWNGGRMLAGKVYADRVKSTLYNYNARGIPYRFTFTNPTLTEDDLNDKYCNELLDMADNGINEVIVNSPLLENYIRKTHPNMKLTSSTCKCIRSIDSVKEELARDYSLVVLDFNFNHDMQALEKLTPDERKRCELLSNAVCIPDCPRRAEHYRYIGEMQRRISGYEACGMGSTLEQMGIKEWDCSYRRDDPFDERPNRNRITPDEIENIYVPMGFENFKLEGRGANMTVMCESIVRYMAKPEHKDKARYLIMGAAIDIFRINY